jgi:hypothetical protein
MARDGELVATLRDGRRLRRGPEDVRSAHLTASAPHRGFGLTAVRGLVGESLVRRTEPFLDLVAQEQAPSAALA